MIRAVSPDQVRGFAEDHDSRLWACLCQILQIPPESCDHPSRVTATLPLVLGGCGLRSAARTSQSAFWASWADCLHMVHQGHAPVADLFVHQLESGTDTPHLGAAVQVARGAGRCARFRGPFVARFGLGTSNSSNFERIRSRSTPSGKGGNTRLPLEWNRNFESVVFPV